MVVEPAQGERDFRMRFYNNDGSVGEMCGNGARCICRYGYETGLVGPTQRVETTSKPGHRGADLPRAYRVRLNDPTPSPSMRSWRRRGRFGPAPMWAGQPPACPTRWSPYPGLAGADPRPSSAWAGPWNHPRFPKGANVNFYEVTGPDQVLEKTYERGGWRTSPWPAAPAPAAWSRCSPSWARSAARGSR